MARSDTKKDIEAVVSPDMGMSLLHFSIDRVPILQKSRQKDFVEGRKGFGPLILPHFNQRASYPAVPDTVLKQSAHISYMKKNGINDPFQHGIGRYASWDYEVRTDEEKVSVAGTLTGETEYHGIPVSDIVGFDFTAFVTYTLSKGNLTVKLDITGDEPVAAGIHFYYAVPQKGESAVSMSVDSIGKLGDDSLFEFSSHQKDGKFFTLSLKGGHDTVFYPVNEADGFARYKLKTPDYRLDTRVRVQGNKEETFDSVVVFSPEDADFVCIEPLSEENGLVPSKKKFSGEIILHPIL
jgi:galactose mutarotase-like enzyme